MTALPEFDTTEKAATGGLPDFEVALPEFGEDVITAPKSPEQLAVQNFMGRKETGFPSPGDVTSFGARLSQASNLPIKAGGAVVADILNRGRMESALEGTAPAETKQAVVTPESMRMETPEEKSQRTEFRGDKPLIPVQGTAIDPEGTDAQRLLSQFSTPEQLLMFPASMSPVGRALMIAQMPGQIIQQVKETVAGQGTDEEKRDRINNLFAMGVMIAHGSSKGKPGEAVPQPEWAKPIGPVATGESLVMPPGAPAPRAEVTAPVEATPKELQAELDKEIGQEPVPPTTTPALRQTGDAYKAGLAVKSIEDLEALAKDRKERVGKGPELLRRAQEATDPAEKERLMNEALSVNAQLPREAIEAATNTGSATEGPGSQLGKRPLDWREHPEVADWLRKNSAELGIELPDELKPEAPKPAAPAAPKAPEVAPAAPAVEPPAAPAAAAPAEAPPAAPAPEAKEPWQMTRSEAVMDRPIPLEQGWKVSVRYLDNPAGPTRGTDEIWTESKPTKGQSGSGPFGRYVVKTVSRDRPSRKQPEYSFREQWAKDHRASVEQAIKAGKPVPPEVLRDYPELSGKPGELKEADDFTGKAAVAAEKATVEWATHVEDVVNPLKAKIRKLQSEVGQMTADAQRTKPEAKGKRHLTKKAFLEQYGVATMDEANALYKQKNTEWADLEKQLEAAETKRKELESAKERRGKEWSSAATRAGELRRQVYPKVREGDVDQPAAAPADQQQPQLPGTAPTPATMLGPGASGAAGEINPTGPRGTPEPPTYGPAARVLESRRQRGVIAPVEPGVGTTPEAEIQRGRQLLSQGADPEKIMAETDRTKRFNSDDAAVLRAHGERLEQAAYAAADQHGVNSPEYEKAWEADSAWSKRMKSVATEWHRVGQGLQGETEIDTGTFHGLRKAFLDATGKDFTEKQAADATRIAKGVKDAADAADKAKDDVVANLDKETAKAPEKPTTGKQGEAVPDAKTLWRRAKAMLDSGETDFDNIRQKLAIEFGIPMKEVSRLLAEPKGSRKLTDDMYRKMSDRRRLVSQAKNWIKNQQIPGWLKFIRAVPRAFFIDKIIGHGTVGMITHAGLNVFNPGAWKTYWPEFFRQYKLLAKPAYHERMMQDLIRDPNFVKARRAGLANDPFRYTDDYNSAFSQYFKRLGLGGSRGFDSLKLFRQARFNQLWDRLPDASRTPDMAQVIADGVNHATGTVRMPFREWANWTFFAPKLEGSRWAWMVGDPLKAAKTFSDWHNSTPEARAQAMSQLKEKAAVTGTYLGLLALNQGILQAMGSNQKINYTNPRRGDFLAFKVAGYNLGVVSPMLGMVRLFANLIHAAAGTRGQVEKLDTRAAESGKLGEQYLRGKLSPFAGFGVDVISQADFQGRPMPYSSDRTPAYLRREGLGPYTYGEYAAQQFTPIPVSEAIREVWRDQGINENQINTWLHALTVAGIMGATGARLSTPTPEAPAPKEKFSSFQSLLK